MLLTLKQLSSKYEGKLIYCIVSDTENVLWSCSAHVSAIDKAIQWRNYEVNKDTFRYIVQKYKTKHKNIYRVYIKEWMNLIYKYDFYLVK